MDKSLDQLSYLDQKSLISALNKNNSWHQLAISMQFLDCEMDKITSSDNHAETLLDIWGGKYGHTIMELFALLKKHKLYTAMNIIKLYVPTKYHKLIKLDEEPQVQQDTSPENQAENQNVVQRNQAEMVTRDNNNTKKNLSVTQVVESAGSITPVSYQELEDCTSQWSPETVLGRGGYATVFRGRWKHTVVAIKRIEAKRDKSGAHEEQLRQSITELQFLNAYRHENILPIYAYSIGGPYPCLVYQFMPGGSLDKRIHTQDRTKFLPWDKRLAIAIGAARGLQYLHTLRDTPLVHVDIKPANILLDANDIPKIGDFGLARLGPAPSQEDVKVSHTFGTLPYLPMDYVTSKSLKPSLDVYSFGVLLFEMATGLPVVTDSRPNRFLKDHVVKYPEKDVMQLEDRRVPGGNKIFVFFITLGKCCVEMDPAQRPTMVMVLQVLEKDFDNKVA